MAHFIDRQYGGAYRSVNSKGEPSDTRKQTYTQTFFIYGMAEYYRATGDKEALQTAKDIFEAFEKYALDRESNGYFEVFTRDWKRSHDKLIGETTDKDEKTMNTSLHLMEAYTNLYRVWPDKRMAERLSNIINIFLNHIIDTKTSHLICFMDRNWKPTSMVDSYGHDIEASWLLCEATGLLGDKDMMSMVKQVSIKIADAASEGLQPDGSLVYEKDLSTGHLASERSWWPQSEAIVGYLNAYEISGDEKYLDRSVNCWNYTKNHLVDNKNGGWFSGASESGTPLKGDKGGFWICPYHNGRMCMEVIERVSQQVSGQVKYVSTDERRDAGMGVERVARFFIPAYESKRADKDDEVRWIQIDLGTRKKIEGVKLLPKVVPWGYVSSEGFPSRFKIEVADDPDFKNPVMYIDQTREDYPDPFDEVCTFTGKVASARYLRLTATHLRQGKLSFTKVMILSDGSDIAAGCKVSDSGSESQGLDLLTRQPRPQGEYVVTDNPGNIIPPEKWKPVSYKARTPKTGVKIGEGLFRRTMENNISYLMSSFTLEELVRNFLVKAGKPVNPLEERLNNFWFVDLPGQEAGRFMMGAGNTLRWIEDPELRKRMDQIVDVIDECKEPDGYIMAYPKYRIFSGEYGAYTRSWVTHGLIEAGYAGNPRAFPLLRGFYDWFNASCYLPELLRRAGQGSQGIIPSTRMYFTPVGRQKDILVVQQYFQENYWMKQLADRDPAAVWLYPYDRPHNYLLTAIEPYLDLYRATGEKKYLDAASGAWDLYHDNWEHVGGSIAICEGTDLYPPKSYYLHRSTGELCGSVFWAFLNQRFHLLYPEEEKYVNEIEKSIYNNLIANQDGDKGIRYHSVLVDQKDIESRQPHCMSTCCEGQGTRMMGALPEFIYSIADDGVYVDLYASSTIKFPVEKGMMTLNMETRFPYDRKVELKVKVSDLASSKIRIRIPSWAAHDMQIDVNGKKMAAGKPGTYVTLSGQWKNNDVISFTLPMNFRMTKYSGEEKETGYDRYALEYGPILMACVRVKDQKDKMVLPVMPDKLLKSLIPVPGKPLHFKLNGNTGLEYMPYFEVQEELFSCYPMVAQKN
jgi:DUF1680 family protein/mannose/cellobiose epimerase-like protein (N-acyl-D-glucosamine 2-epimerase family)